jgi:hypothetical protein
MDQQDLMLLVAMKAMVAETSHRYLMDSVKPTMCAGFGLGFGFGAISDRLVTVDASTPTDTEMPRNIRNLNAFMTLRRTFMLVVQR